MNVHVVKSSNGEVTKFYLDIVNNAITEYELQVNNVCESNYVNSVEEAYAFPKSDLFIASNIIIAYKLLRKGYKNVVTWFQGIEPEESYMRNHSRLRYWILSYIESYCLKRSVFNFFVSNDMKHYYIRKYHLDSMNNCIIMPCFNTQIDRAAFFCKDKYVNNQFCYVGSTAKWQRFEDIVKIYRSIEMNLDNSKLIVLTLNVEEAMRIVEASHILRYEVKRVKPEEVPNEIRKCKYGFIIREDCVVNNVATPTKIANYIASGVIPVFSECIHDFSTISQEMKYYIKIKDDECAVRQILEHCKKTILANDIYADYAELFDHYYNPMMYRNEIVQKCKEVFI